MEIPYHDGSDFNNLSKLKIKKIPTSLKLNTQKDLKLMKSILERNKISKYFEKISIEISNILFDKKILFFDKEWNQSIDLEKKLDKETLNDLKIKLKNLEIFFYKNIKNNIWFTKDEKDFYLKNIFSIKWILTNYSSNKKDEKYNFNF